MTGIPALVVGTGFGVRVHVPALRAAGFEVVGLVATRPDRLERKAADAGIAATFTDLDEAIDRTGAKLVTVATTPATHARLAHTAIARGCHVLCEKPFAFDAAEARDLLDAAEAAGVVHAVAHEFRWQPERALFGRAIADGLIGEPRFLVVDQFLPMAADPQARMPGWWFDKAAGGGWLGAGGSHMIDQIRAWLGEIASLSARLLVVSDRGAVADDSYSMRFTMAGGVEGSMQQSVGAWGDPVTQIRCAGSKGTVWLDRGAVMLADASGTRALDMPDDLAAPPATPGGRPASFELPSFTRLCESLAALIEGRPAPTAIPIPTFRDGLATMLVMDAMRASSAADGALQRLG